MTRVRPLVLVADDDPDIVELVRLGLEREGCEVMCACDGADALALAEERCPDLAVLDLAMPAVGGLEVMRRLRARPDTAGVPIVVLTAAVQDRDRTESMAAGATAWMGKPFSPRALGRRVSQLLDR